MRPTPRRGSARTSAMTPRARKNKETFRRDGLDGPESRITGTTIPIAATELVAPPDQPSGKGHNGAAGWNRGPQFGEASSRIS